MIGLLFDIDGTLVDTGGAGVAPFERGLKEAIGQDVELVRDKNHGLTDYQIAFRFTDSAEEAVKAVSIYERELSRAIGIGTVKALGGVKQTLAGLASLPNFHLHILTGNTYLAAQIKLSSASIMDLFVRPFFCVQPEDESRVDILRRAVASCTDCQSFVVIGDTAFDAAAAEMLGIDFIAVTSNRFTTAAAAAYSNIGHMPHPWRLSRLIELVT